MMKKVFVNGAEFVRVLSPFMYKDTIKSLDKSNESRVELDGVRVAVSCVTSGRDVKNAAGGMKFHLYFYPTAAAAAKRDTAGREWMPLTAEEYRAYKNDPGYTIVLKSVPMVAAPETEVVVASDAGNEGTTEVVAPETEVVAEPETGNEGTTRKSRRK
jgi:hypothetical protein